jgi:hypothetical protein
MPASPSSAESASPSGTAAEHYYVDGHYYVETPEPVQSHGEAAPAARSGWFLFGCFSLVPLAGATWMTLFGIIAIVQIRRSNGQITGLWLAIFDAVLFPTLALMGLLSFIVIA